MADTKTQTEYYVSKGETQLGPWTIAEIANRLATGEVAATDYVYEDAKSDWVALVECAAFKEHLAKSKPKSAPPQRKTSESAPQTVQAQTQKQETRPTVSSNSEAADAEWFVQKGANRYGPFSYLGVVRALQDKTVYEFDLIWREGMSEWVRIAEHDEFTAEKIRALALTRESGTGIFHTRQYPRVSFDSEVIVHDNRSAWLGRAYEGSAGGSGLVIENATLVPGQTVLLHFAATNELPSFNALCEIVGKKYTKDIKDAKSPVHYAVRFLRIDPMAEPKVMSYFKAA